METWDPLEIQGSATSEIVAAAKKREIPGGHPNSPSDGHFKIPHLSA